MREQCFEESVIQAFFDGELRAEMLEKVARHISDCDSCAMLMSDVEGESASVAAAFEIENFELVPTERLRTKIFEEIAEYEGAAKTSWLKAIAAMFGLSNGFRLNGPSVAAFASLALVAGVVAVLLTSKQDVQMAKVDPPKRIEKTVNAAPVTPAVDGRAVTSGPVQTRATEATEAAVKTARQAVYTEIVRPDVTVRESKGPVAAEAQPLEEETQYIKTINTLKKSVDDRKDNSLNPSALVAYERDMAVVDNAIKTMQKEVRRNPKDEGAKQILISSYQNKIDLLSAVSEKTDLVASLR
jgi:anti-sigma factor RsiW